MSQSQRSQPSRSTRPPFPTRAGDRAPDTRPRCQPQAGAPGAGAAPPSAEPGDSPPGWGYPRGGGGLDPRPTTLRYPAPVAPCPRRDAPRPPGHAPGRRSRGERRMKVKVGARLPPASQPSAAALSASPSVSPASRPPLRRARPLSGLPAVSLAGGRREPPPPPAGSSASSRAPLASPHPCEWPGGSQLAAGPPPPLPRRNQWAPASGKPRPPPGGGGPSWRRAGLRKGRRAKGGSAAPPLSAPGCLDLPRGSGGAAAVRTPGRDRSITASPRPPASPSLPSATLP
ncbi:unnamed protein product [Rangifer tarandus platyrhynchus]|uniref:Uncharacterized protein n=1 Tax=Rangifer tarandus platyrhynchus TaxID=3082113 RepID=A0AC59YRI6_RANTA